MENLKGTHGVCWCWKRCKEFRKFCVSFLDMRDGRSNLEPPYTSNLGGKPYMESVCCCVNIAHLTFHGMFFREVWGKLGMICVAGKPNMAKTKEIMGALHMSSSRQFFYAMKVFCEVIEYFSNFFFLCPRLHQSSCK